MAAKNIELPPWISVDNTLLLTEGSNNISLSDLASLKLPTQLKTIPTSYFDFEKCLGMFGNLLLTLFGMHHGITLQFCSYWTNLQTQHHLRLRAAIQEHRTIHPIHLLRSVQLKCFNYFESL
jgi:hypothetical protein